MKRSKCSGKANLTPVTERILARMGAKGTEIRRRLQQFLQERQDQVGEVFKETR